MIKFCSYLFKSVDTLHRGVDKIARTMENVCENIFQLSMNVVNPLFLLRLDALTYTTIVVM